MTITLPTVKSTPTQLNPRNLVIYGAPKVGKTTVLAQLDNCLILDFDKPPGTDMVPCLRIVIESLEHLGEVCSEIRAQGKPYKYIAMDTITSIEEWAEELATKKYKASPTGKNFTGDSVLQLTSAGGFSPGYLWLRLAFGEITQMVASVAQNLIQVGHLRAKELASDKSQVNSKDLDLTGKIRNIVCSKADAVGYMFRRTGMDMPLEITFQTLEEVNCGSRCAHIKGKTFPFDWNKIYLPEVQ